jgi:tetratricopeptide (TPR) repeat protein
VYAICKNEEKFVSGWMDSMKEADLVVVTDTGSTDGTVEALRSRGAVVYEEEINPWRFDTARNLSLSHVPEDVDIAVCTDLDEVFHPGWRKILEDAWYPGLSTGQYLYNWSLRPDGTPDSQFWYFKIHARHEYTWECPIHEYLKYIGTSPEQKTFMEGIVLDHHPDPTKSRSSYLPLLEMAVAEKPDSDRMTYYLGREYMYARRWEDCIRTLERHLQLPTATWKEERCASMRAIAKSYQGLGDKEQAYKWFLRAIAELPKMRDAYVELALMAYGCSDWPTAFYMSEEALKIKKKSNSYINMGYAWNYTPHDLAAIACYRLGMMKRSLFHGREALAQEPEDKRLQNNLELILKAQPNVPSESDAG